MMADPISACDAVRHQYNSSQTASNGSDRPSSKTTQGNMSSIWFMANAMPYKRPQQRREAQATMHVNAAIAAREIAFVIIELEGVTVAARTFKGWTNGLAAN
jgi:hypothetical protein